MNRRGATALALVLATLAAVPAAAQMPFDMTPELNTRETPVEPTPAPQTQAPAQTPAQPTTPQTPATSPETAAPPEAAENLAPAAPPTVAGELRRPFMPLTGMRLEGEIASRRMGIFLTAAQAAAPARLELDLINAIVVAPEASVLEVMINNTVVTAAPINFPSGEVPLVADVPPGTLQPGLNIVSIRANQRHRTDCSVLSTYELWTELHTAGSALVFEGEGLDQITDLAELPAVGLSEAGQTTLQMVLPQSADPAARTAALMLVQHLALVTGTPVLDIVLADDVGATAAGALNVVVATADALPASAEALRGQAQGGPFVGMLPGDSNTLVVSGPAWSDVRLAIGAFEEQATTTAGNRGGSRLDLPNAVPVYTGAASVPLGAMGVQTEEFNGRRFHTDLQFALPGDFFANEYGEAQLLLDAAYSAEVLPGSQLDIYVNGEIAAVFPILTTDGGAFRNTRLRIPMTNFRPGINEMDIEAILLTRQDELCAPGLTGRAAPRFLFSSGSELRVPDFARIAEYPDLAVLAGTAAPYREAEALPTLVPDDHEALRAAMLLMARVALSSGGMVQTEVVDEAQLDPTGGAIVVSPLTVMTETVRTRSRVVDPATEEFTVTGDTDAALEQWQQSTAPAGSNPVDAVWGWLARQFNLRPENFWLLRREDGAYVPQSSTAAILSQARQPEGGIWTVLTIPAEDGFADAVEHLVQPAVWAQVDGRISAVGAEDDNVLVVQPQQTVFEQTQPLSFSNARLIAANWLSSNVLAYAGALAFMAIVLTILTSMLIGRGVRRR